MLPSNQSKTPFYARYALAASASALILTLSACSSTPPATTQTRQQPATLEDIAQTAYDLARQADLVTDEITSNHYRVLAAEKWLQEGDLQQARYQIDLVDPLFMAEPDSYLLAITEVNLLLAENRPVDALELVRSNTLNFSEAGRGYLNEWYAASGQVFSSNGEFDRAALAYFQCQDSSRLQEICQDGLWYSLNNADRIQLDNLQDIAMPEDMHAWLELAEVSQMNLGDLSTQSSALQTWQNRYRNHPAARRLPGSLANLESIAAKAPAQIAVLLPLSGPLSTAGNAVLDGVLSAYYASAAQQIRIPEITIFDTESLPLDLLFDIVRTGNYDGIIGPLERERVELLLDYNRLQIPIVALNRLPPASNREQPILGIGLAVESEARQIVERASRDGHHAAILIAPNTAWGDRASSTFASNWQNLDNSLAAILHFSGTADQAPLLESALHINQSAQRRGNLQSLLGKQLSFTPRRREDVDMLYMAASPDQARQLIPLMAFFFAEDLPVYATSNIFSGAENADLDRDLDDVIFLNYPWVFEPNPRVSSLPNPTEPLSQDLKNLQSLGVDAYYLLRRSEQLQKYPQTTYHGRTGNLYKSSDGNIERRMPWATFRGGLLTRVDN